MKTSLIFHFLQIIVFEALIKTQGGKMNKTETVNLEQIILKLLNYRKFSYNNFVLSQEQISAICYKARLIFLSQPMLLQLNPPINICGDIHGQFFDLKEIFKTIGTPTHGENFLFLGDYVDRGQQSLQCICLLFAYKIQFPQKIFLLRGNHQCSQMNKIYGFYDECKRRSSLKIWKLICDAFKCLPVAAVVGDRIFCVHGGLSPFLDQLQSINKIIRPVEPQKNTMLNDLLWSDPGKNKGWSKNLQRGTSHCFGEDIVEKFLEKNDFDLICRSHQVAEDGYEFFSNRRLITIFSSPNYCSLYNNLGAILMISNDMNCQIKQFQRQSLIRLKIKRQNTPQINQLKLNIENTDTESFRYRKSSCQKRRQSLNLGLSVTYERNIIRQL